MATTKEFPKPLPLRQLIGPSFVILALGLGSGEVILWPYLASNYGLGIAWGALLGITFQYFINMEIERYALVKGESVFVGIHRLWPRAAYWFILTTFIGFGLPGIIAASAQVFGSIIGVADFRWIAIIFLIIIGLVLSAGKTVYGLMEKLTKGIILIGVPIVFILTLILADGADWQALAQGLMGVGEGFRWLPEGIVLATFLAAFAYSGAGGNLNLTQSIYVKEKGYGMGKYAPKIAGLFRGGADKEAVSLDGYHFEETPANMQRFRQWWRNISLEHLVVFWFVGALSMLLLMLLAYTTTFGLDGTAEGISFVIFQGAAIGQQIFPAAGVAFLVVVTVMLFQTQLGVMDSTSRIMAENAALRKGGTVNLSKWYFIFVWAQIAFGIILFLFNISEPKSLLVLGAVINAVAMFVHIGIVSWTNYRQLPKACQPSLLRRLVLLGIFCFFGYFSFMVLRDAVLPLLP